MNAGPPHGDLSPLRDEIPPALERLCDDASMFPPGLAPVDEAVPSHVEHSRSSYRRFLGPFILAAANLDAFAPQTTRLPDRSIWLALTVPSPAELETALRRAVSIPAVRLAGAEVVVPDDMDPRHIAPRIAAALDGAGIDTTEIYVEVPRDDRRPAVLDALADSDFDAKFRTGGVRADLYPDEDELADAILAAVTRHLPFKATAGLHHAIRNTDPETGFEQHGFLNLFLAVDAARQGVDSDRAGLRERVVEILGDRDSRRVADAVARLSPSRAMAVRASFTSFGSCSVLEPLTELIDLGLIHPQGAT